MLTTMNPATVQQNHTARLYTPAVDVLESADEFTLYFDMPGVNGQEIDVRYEDGTLWVRGRAAARQSDDTRFQVREYGVGDYERSFRVSDQIDASKIWAQYADGELVLHLPKIEAAQPRKIEVRVQ